MRTYSRGIAFTHCRKRETALDFFRSRDFFATNWIRESPIWLSVGSREFTTNLWEYRKRGRNKEKRRGRKMSERRENLRVRTRVCDSMAPP